MDPVNAYDPESFDLSGWLPGLVNGQHEGTLFVIPFRFGLSAVVPIALTESFQLAVGHFVEVRIRRNRFSLPHHRSRHFVEYVRCIPEDAWPPCKVGPPPKKIVFVEARAIPKKVTSENVLMLENRDFGLIIDISHKVPKWVLKKSCIVVLEFTTILSPKDRFQSIFAVQKVIDIEVDERSSQDQESSYSRVPEPRRRPVEIVPKVISGFGLVGHIFERGLTFVWSPLCEKDIVGQRLGPAGESLLGKWISFTAQEYGDEWRIMNSVEIIEDKLPTRLSKNVPEIQTRCVYRGDTTVEGYRIFESLELGRVVDSLRLTPTNAYDLSVWVMRHSRPDGACRWKIVKVEGGNERPRSQGARTHPQPAPRAPVDYGDLSVNDGGVYSDDEEEEMESKFADMEVSALNGDAKQPGETSSASSTLRAASPGFESQVPAASVVPAGSNSHVGKEHHIGHVGSRSMSVTSTVSSAADPANGHSMYHGKDANEMLLVLLENPVVSAAIESTDLDAFVHINNLVFQ